LYRGLIRPVRFPSGIYFAGRSEITLAFIGAAVLFLPLFVFLPKLIQRAIKMDPEAALKIVGVITGTGL
jgi:hypothetical protein